MSRLIFESLVLSELVLEFDSKVVQMLLLVKYHLETEFVYLSLFIKKVNDSFLTFIGFVHIDCFKVIQIVRLTFAVEEFDRLKHFRVLIELLNLTQSRHL